jgi:ribosomal protein S27AE
MRVYFTQLQQIKKKKKGAKFLDRACVRCGCGVQVADGAIKAAKDAARDQ